MLKQNYIFLKLFLKNVDQFINNSRFQSDFKLTTSNNNYRPESIIPNISKKYKRCLYNQMQRYFDNTSMRFSQGLQFVALSNDSDRKIA